MNVIEWDSKHVCLFIIFIKFEIVIMFPVRAICEGINNPSLIYLSLQIFFTSINLNGQKFKCPSITEISLHIFN